MSLYLGDCLDVLASLDPQSVDAVICDPPYGTTRSTWDAVIPMQEMWRALRRVCVPGAPMVFTATLPFTAALVMSNPKAYRHSWVWEKNKATGHLNAKRAPMRAHEDVLVFCDGAPPYTPQMTEGHARKVATRNRGKDPTPVYGHQAFVEQRYDTTIRYPRSVQRFDIVNNDDAERVHSSQKPVDLFRYLIRTYTQPGQTVLDFAMGSGTTGLACRIEGRRFIGIEKYPEIFAVAETRLRRNAA